MQGGAIAVVGGCGASHWLAQQRVSQWRLLQVQLRQAGTASAPAAAAPWCQGLGTARELLDGCTPP